MVARTGSGNRLSVRMAMFWMLAIVIVTVFSAGLYVNWQNNQAEQARVESRETQSPTAEPAPAAKSSPGVAGAVAGFGLFGGWVVVGAVMVCRGQKAKAKRAAET